MASVVFDNSLKLNHGPVSVYVVTLLCCHLCVGRPQLIPDISGKEILHRLRDIPSYLCVCVDIKQSDKFHIELI